MAVDPGRFDDLVERVNTHDEKIAVLSEKVSEFVGAAKGANKVLAVVVGLSAIAQVALQFLLRTK